jgi:signal transduction histidine kinase
MSYTAPALFEAPRRPARTAYTTDSQSGETQYQTGTRRLLACAMLGVLVCMSAVLAIHTTRGVGPVAALWVAGGVALVGWLEGPRTRAFDFMYGGFIAMAIAIANMLAGNDPTRIAIFTVANLSEIVLAVVLVRWLSPGGVQIDSLAALTRFFLTAPVLAPIPAALLVGLLIAAPQGQPVRPIVESWWMGHALGFTLVTTLAVAVRRTDWREFANAWRMVEAAVIIGALATAAYILFMSAYRSPANFIITPLLLLAAVRLRVLGAAVAVIIVAIAAMLGVAEGAGPASRFDLSDGGRVRLLQLYLVVSCLPMLLVAVMLNERDRMAAAAREGQRIAETASLGKSRLLASVSHEIRSPLAGIVGLSGLLIDNRLGQLTTEQRQTVETIAQTAGELETLSGDLLDVARAEAGAVAITLRPVEIDAVVEDVRQKVARMPEAAGLKWILRRDEAEPLLAQADPAHLSRILSNLLDNAVRYGGAGGEITLRLAKPDFAKVRIEVIDRGAGIAEDKQVALFDPFNRLGAARTPLEGLGVGLALARRLTELQGGTLGFESREGHGSRFWIDLPAA